MKMKEIIVSVVIPTYNCASYIKQTLNSVLAQTVPLEVIIIDDASLDATEKEIQDYLSQSNVRYIRNQKNQGVSITRNRGVDMAKGKYIAFLDADDWWDKNKLEKQLWCIQKNKSVLCYTGRELYQSNGRTTGKVISVAENISYQELLYYNNIACSSVLIETKVAKEFPMQHDEVHEDYLMWLRVLQRYQKACGVNEPLLKTRLTPNGKSRNKWKSFSMTYGVYRYLGIRKRYAFYYTGNHLIRSAMRYI